MEARAGLEHTRENNSSFEIGEQDEHDYLHLAEAAVGSDDMYMVFRKKP